MRLLYVFPHPDDECFGPGPAIARQLGDGHEVHLLTLTRGGATKVRHGLGLSVEQMGEVRFREMLAVERTLGLTGMEVLDLPDGRLKHVDPLEIEALIESRVRLLAPDVLITYAVHGVSGFPDHLVSHAVVKRVWCELRRSGTGPARLAFFTMPPSDELETGSPRLFSSPESDIGCRVPLADEDLAAGRRALECYESYREVIAAARPLDRIRGEVCFELFGEAFDPPLADLTERLDRDLRGADRSGSDRESVATMTREDV